MKRAGGTIGGLGEWGLLSRLLPRLSRGLSRRVALGPGDDAALVRLGAETLAVTTDMLVEGVHFRREWTTSEELGHKTLAVNLSDLAAMGDVEPVAGVLAAGIPLGTPVAWIDGFYRGLARLARSHRFDVVGGDTVRSDRLVFSLAALGRVRGPVLTRDGARVGDAVMVTGTLGDAAAGLAALRSGRKRAGSRASGPSPVVGARRRWRAGSRASGPSPVVGARRRWRAGTAALLQRLAKPTPRLEWGRRLARGGGVTAALDSSDGFWRSLRLLGEASKVGAQVWADRLPTSAALRRWAGPRAEDFALVGGEEYELVFTARPAAVQRIERMGFARVVGRIVPRGKGLRVFHNGRAREVPSGFEHFDC